MWPKIFICLIFFASQSGIFEAQGRFVIEDGEARWGTLPLFNISVYINTIFEPHNALVHASQNFLNFLMGTIFWVTAAGLYYKVNPIIGSRREEGNDYEYYLVADDFNPNIYANLSRFINHGSSDEESPSYYDLPRGKREVHEDLEMPKKLEGFQALAAHFRATATTIQDVTEFLENLW